MTEYIDKDALVAEIERRKHKLLDNIMFEHDKEWVVRTAHQLNRIIMYLDTLEVKEVDLEKLGEIARHLIVVKEHIEDMRLDKEEWFMLEKIGYPERFKAQKGE
jgi:Asp-tRNA(Asn)/Glu-tRNA(Gln) amidotransferase C subunit